MSAPIVLKTAGGAVGCAGAVNGFWNAGIAPVVPVEPVAPPGCTDWKVLGGGVTGMVVLTGAGAPYVLPCREIFSGADAC